MSKYWENYKDEISILETKTENKFKKMVFIMLGILSIFLLWNFAISYNLLYQTPHYVYKEGTLKIENIGGGTYAYPYNTQILCEEGVDVIGYTALNNKVIYGCLTLINGHCSGEGKSCIIKQKIKVIE
jgi:hypothetical protein